MDIEKLRKEHFFLYLLRGIAITFLLILVLISATVLWPIYLGLFILRPGVYFWMYSYKVF